VVHVLLLNEAIPMNAEPMNTIGGKDMVAPADRGLHFVVIIAWARFEQTMFDTETPSSL
jgi:hypothetical protein